MVANAPLDSNGALKIAGGDDTIFQVSRGGKVTFLYYKAQNPPEGVASTAQILELLSPPPEKITVPGLLKFRIKSINPDKANKRGGATLQSRSPTV